MGGNIFKRDWFQYVERLPEGIERRAGMDLAAGAKERSDYTSYIEVAEDGDLNLYIVGCFRERLDQGHGTGQLGKPPATGGAPGPVHRGSPRSGPSPRRP